MKINLITFESSISNVSQEISTERLPILDELQKFGEIKIFKEEDLNDINIFNKDSIIICYILSGGTEEIFLNRFPFMPRPIIILSDSYCNSFAAALEICTCLSNSNIEHIHINYPVSPTPTFHKNFSDTISNIKFINEIGDTLQGTKIGLFGHASSWLIASGINKKLVSNKFKVEFVNIALESVVDEFNKLKQSKYRDNEIDSLINKYQPLLINGRTTEHLYDSLLIYHVIKAICIEQKISAMTIQCFSLINMCSTSACIALSILNDQGLVSGCEGDIPALITMLIAAKSKGKISFMANPSSVDEENMTVDFSHCTVPIKMTSSVKLNSHYESQLSIGVQGEVEYGDYTLFKLSGQTLQNSYIGKGKIIPGKKIANRCRTQVTFKFNDINSFKDFLLSRIGNHIILYKG